MIVKVSQFQEVCKKILEAVDSSGIGLVSETLELELINKKLHLNVTNNEYYVTVSIDVDYSGEFHAVVNASLFLSLISKLTTADMQMTIKDNSLVIKSNGNYKIPLIFENDTIVKLPKITIGEVTSNFKISNETLQSVLKFNSKELQKSGIKKVVQKMFYIDEKGAITFTNGACVNSFTLQKPIKILLTEKIVKLFKLFLSEEVEFTLGADVTANKTIQTKAQFKDKNVEITTILSSDSSLINSVPVEAIRGLSSSAFPHSVVLEKRAVLDAINRLSLFDKSNVVTLYTYMSFSKDGLSIYDTRKNNHEEIAVVNGFKSDEPYELILDTNDFRITLETNNDQYVTLNFGNKKAVVIERPNVKNILPECVINL
jgi:hypothetical protein